MSTGSDLLSPDVVAQLLSLADAPGVHAVSVVGSATRGDANPWSDIDVHAYVRLPSQKQDARVAFLGERLVMVATGTVDDSRLELRTPARAVWAVPALLDMRILLDREGKLAALRLEAEGFDWSMLRADAEASECRRLVGSAEYVLIRTENEYYRKAQQSAGPEWAKRHRECFGLTGDKPLALDAFAQGLAACRLYAETAKVLDDVFDPTSREFAARAVRLLG